jgi:hypothetical protein
MVNNSSSNNNNDSNNNNNSDDYDDNRVVNMYVPSCSCYPVVKAVKKDL